MTAPAWTLCPGCAGPLYGPRLARNQHVCPDCGAHLPVPARTRLDQLLDGGWSPVEDDADHDADVLGFADRRPYAERLAEARVATGMDEAVLVATGAIGGHPVVAAAMDFRFLGGSLGAVVGERVTRAAERALATRAPLLLVCASGGARMQEGALALMQMAKTTAALARLDRAGVLTVSLVTDPTYGGVAASYATACDVVVAEPGARLGFAGPRVVAETIGGRPPEGFQNAETLLRHGLIDMVRRRGALRPLLATLLAPSTPDGPAAPAGVVRDYALLAEVDPWRAVRGARELGRPTTTDHLELAFEDFEELHGDRLGEDCPAVVGGLARIGGRAVVVVGTQKGHTPGELTARRFGMGSPAGYRKAARLFRLAEKLGLPVVTLVDTPGAYPGVEAEQHGQAGAISACLGLLSGLRVPVVAVVTGEGGSGGALALAVADVVLALSGSVYSVISPEGCAAILWRDRAHAPAAARALAVDARSLLRLGIVDGVVPEPPGGAHRDPAGTSARLAAAVSEALAGLAGLDTDELLTARHARFRAFGAPRTRVLQRSTT
jgi:acyl-CoA carboxylase subunit beta